MEQDFKKIFQKIRENFTILYRDFNLMGEEYDLLKQKLIYQNFEEFSDSDLN